MGALRSHIGHISDNASCQTALNPDVVLLHLRGGIGRIVHSQASGKNRAWGASGIAQAGVENSGGAAEGRIRGHIINVISLHAFIEGSVAHPKNSVITERTPSDTDSRLEQVPVILHETARNSVLTRDTDA